MLLTTPFPPLKGARRAPNVRQALVTLVSTA